MYHPFDARSVAPNEVYSADGYGRDMGIAQNYMMMMPKSMAMSMGQYGLPVTQGGTATTLGAIGQNSANPPSNSNPGPGAGPAT